jgi:serine/threonine-protein kinase
MAKTRLGRPLQGPRDPFVGKVIAGRYQVLDKLSRSAEGINVYKALHLYVKKFVVAKVMPPHAAQDEILKERFLREGQASNMIQHPNVVEVYDMGETEDGVLYIIMEYLEGEPLSTMLERGPLSPEMAVSVAVQVLEALGPAHAMGVVHRDLNSSHVFLLTRTEEGRFVKVLDFGIAHLAYEPSITQVGQVLGTPYTMAPEQIKDEEITGATDLYSLGCILYAMLTGHYPFEGFAREVMDGHVNRKPRPPGSVTSDVPAALDEIVLRLLAKKPDDRYMDAYEVVRDLVDLGLAIEEDAEAGEGKHDSVPPREPARRTFPPLESEAERGAGPWVKFVEEVGALARTKTERSKAEAMTALTEQLDGIDRRMEEISIKLESLDKEVRHSRLSISRALEELARDQSERNAGLLRSTARVADLHQGMQETSERASRLLAGVVTPEFGPDSPSLTRNIAEALMEMSRMAEQWLQYRDQADRERSRKRDHIRQVRDYDFQLDELRARLEKVTREGEEAMDGYRQQLERYGRRRLILLEDLSKLAEAFRDKIELPS